LGCIGMVPWGHGFWRTAEWGIMPGGGRAVKRPAYAPM
jgi:hypothetical protein